MKSGLAKLNHLFNVLVEILRAEIWILDGLEESTNQPLKIIIAGSETQKNYIEKIAFNSICKESYIGKKYFWHLYYLIKKNKDNCSLAIVEGDVLHRYLYEYKNDFYIPIWLKSAVDIPLLVNNRSSKEDLRRIRKNKLDYIITKEPSQLHDFYYNMYLPSVKSRHQERTIVMEFGKMMQKVEEGDCELLLVTKQGESIAGVLIMISGGMPRLWSNGIRDANPIYWKDRAIAATYYFSSQYLAKQGYKQMHMGLSRSFLADGILQLKKKWNNKVIAWDRKGFIIKPIRISNGVRGFFINNPFVHISKNQLRGAVFIANDKQCSHETFEQFQAKYFIAGLSELNIFSINDNYEKVHRIVHR
jgi:hypothetical protein